MKTVFFWATDHDNYSLLFSKEKNRWKKEAHGIEAILLLFTGWIISIIKNSM